MDAGTYQRLLASVTLPISALPHVTALSKVYAVSEDTVRCIHAQDVQSRVKKQHAALLAGIDGVVADFQRGLEIVQIAYALDLPPCIVARRLMEALRLGLGRAGVTGALRDPAALPTLIKTQGLQGTLLTRLQCELEACTSVDAVCCPRADAARAAAGAAYEERLCACLRSAGVAFWTEEALRARGFFKTPDAKLQVPVAIGGRVVHWIDSKATFGDARMHRTLLAEQYELYVTRFGPGMVIYWHGYVEGLVDHPGVIVLDDFPAESSILRLPCLSITSATTDADGLRVLFCTQDMDSAFQRTRTVVASTLPDVEVRQCHRLDAAVAIRDVDVVVPIAVPITAGMLEAAPRVKLVIQYGVGVDGIDIPAATRLGICVANIPSLGTGNAVSVAEHAVYLALASLRQHHAMQQALESQRLGIPEGRTLWGSTVLIVGYGNIARELVTRLRPFGCRLLCLRRSDWPVPRDGAAAGLEDVGTFPADTARLAAQADVVILTCTLNPTSQGLVGTSFLAACKRGVHIVNIARGGLLDREAVAVGLRDGTIGGMGLDVYWDEPLGSDPSHAGDGIADHPNVYLTPHLAGVTNVSYQDMAEILAGEVARVDQGRLPSHPLNHPVNARLPLPCRKPASAQA